MADVLSAEEGQTILRGMLYQVYRRGTLDVGGRNWSYKIGSITYPDRRRGWVSTLFLHAAAAVKNDPTQWLTVLVGDETQKPDAEELAGIFKTALVTLTARAVAEEK
jgi:hypothetical protein